VRVETAFNRVLALPATVVTEVSLTTDAVVVAVRRRARRHYCPCGWSTRARYDTSRRRWRHLDLAGQRLWLQADIARINCRPCGRVRTETVPWARPGARSTRAVEDTIAWLAQRMDKSAIAALMRCSWRTVDATVRRLVGEHLAHDTDAGAPRLDGLTRIGVDEISYKRGHSYLTVVVDHDTARVVWVGHGRTQQAFEEFTTALGPDRRDQIQAVTMDMSHIYRGAAERTLPDAQICFDPFHVIKWTNEALDKVLDGIRGLRPNPDLRKTATGRTPRTFRNGATGWVMRAQATIDADVATQQQNWIYDEATGRFSRRAWRRARFLLRSGAERLDPHSQDQLAALRGEDLTLARAWELKEGLRDLYRLFDPTSPPEHIRGYLDAWCTAATDSRIGPFVTLARRVRRHFTGIAAAVERGLSNSRAEGINTKIRLIQRRGYGHHHPHTLAAMIHLCLGSIHVQLPGRTPRSAPT
jgi:transposase